MPDNSSDRADEIANMWNNEVDDEDDEDADDDTGAVDASGETDASDTSSTMDATETTDDSRAMDASDAQDTPRTEWDVDSIRDAWNPNSVRLPDSIQDVFATEYKRLDYELSQADTNFAFTKDRYFKPLVVALGLQQLQAMEPEEIADRVDAMEQQELLDE